MVWGEGGVRCAPAVAKGRDGPLPRAPPRRAKFAAPPRVAVPPRDRRGPEADAPRLS